MRKLKSETTFQIVINIILIFLTLCSLLPFVLLIMSSVTQESALIADGYQFWPRVFSLDAYRYIIARAGTIFKAYGITMLVTLVGTTISLIITPLLAYPLSRQDFKLHNVMSFLVFFTMLFNGGLVPTYMMWTQIFHIKNTLPALIIPALLLNAFNVMLMKNYFKMNIPYSLIEAAKIDGAGEWKQFRYITLPGIAPTTFFLLMAGIGAGLTIFDPAKLLAPVAWDGLAGLDDMGLTVSYYIYIRTNTYLDMTKASVMSWALFAVAFSLQLLIYKIRNRSMKDEY